MQGCHAAVVGALRREKAAARSIKRLGWELEAVQDVLKQYGHAVEGFHWSQSVLCLQGGHAALVGALRREEAAARSIKRLERELKAVQDVLKQRDMDAQRTKMIIRLKEDKIARLQVGAECCACTPIYTRLTTCKKAFVGRSYRCVDAHTACLKSQIQTCKVDVHAKFHGSHDFERTAMSLCVCRALLGMFRAQMRRPRLSWRRSGGRGPCSSTSSTITPTSASTLVRLLRCPDHPTLCIKAAACCQDIEYLWLAVIGDGHEHQKSPIHFQD